MSLSMYQASAPRFAHTLKALSAILDKAQAHAEARKIDPLVLTGSRLYPDMFTMSKQVQIAADMAKGGVARLAGEEPPRFEDTETTLIELVARCNKTIDYIKGFKPAQIDGSENKTISLTAGGNSFTFKGVDYLQSWVLPNFFFHVTTAYNLLRHGGVQIGKMDFLGKVQ